MGKMIEVTRDMIIAASDYMPNAEKEAWVTATAKKCFDRLAITSNGETMPEMYMINTGIKSRYLMTALVSKYFHQPYEADTTDDALISEADYDRWAGGHIFGQLERWKKDYDLRNKCFDLLYDFNDLRNRLTSQIMGLLTIQNDSVLRQSQYMDTQFKQLPQIIEQLKELTARKGETDGD